MSLFQLNTYKQSAYTISEVFKQKLHDSNLIGKKIVKC